MKVYIREISEEEYKNKNLSVLFDDQISDRTFAILTNDEDIFKMGWQSTDISPSLINLTDRIFAIGVDLNFVIIDISTKKALMRIKLNYFFYEFKIIDNILLVITELEIIKVNIVNFQIDEKYALSDFFETIETINKRILVKTVDGNLINIG